MLTISVVVCTRTRPEMVDACLASLTGQDYPAFEVVVVDNTDEGDLATRGESLAAFDGRCIPAGCVAPRSNTPGILGRRALPPGRLARLGATPDFHHGLLRPLMAGDPRVRVVRESRRGLSVARNTGVLNARYDILAFIDDDVTAEQGWIRAVAAALEDDSIAGVTGLVVPAELETAAQREFEWYGGMGKGAARRLNRGSALTAWQTIGAQEVGVGANMAFRRSVFERVGGFDEALGAGTVSLGAEDLDFFHRVLRAGLTICYEPAARVRHRHRRTIAELRRQIFSNGCSYSVYLLKIWSRRSVPRWDVATFAAWWMAGRVGTALFRTIARPGLRCLLAWDEVRGAIRAPAAYRLTYRGA